MIKAVINNVIIFISVVLSTCSLFNVKAYGAEIKFSHVFDTNQQNSGAIIQDRDGFLWVGSYGNGLYKYNGYDLKIYRAEPGSVSNNNILSIYEDSEGLIWIGTQSGLDMYNKESDSFTNFKHDPKNPHSLSYDTFMHSIYTICEDSTGIIWIGTQGGLNAYSKKTGKFTRYLHKSENPNSLSNNKIRFVYAGKKNYIWIGTDGGGLNRLEPSTGKFTHYKFDQGNSKSISDNSLTAWIEDSNGLLWIGTMNGGLNSFDRNKGIFTRYKYRAGDSKSLCSNEIFSIYEDSLGRIWLGRFYKKNAGLEMFNRKTGVFTHYRHNSKFSKNLSSNSILNVLEDRAGILWVVNDVSAIDNYDKNIQKFKLYKHDPKNRNSLAEKAVVPVMQDSQGMIWIGTFPGGLNKYNKKTKKFTHYRHRPGDFSSIPNDYIPWIFEDSSKTFWLGSAGAPAKLSIFNRNTGKCIKHYSNIPGNSNSLTRCDQINYIFEDLTDSNILWVGTYGGGLDKFNKRKQTFKHYKHDPKNKSSLSNDNMWAIHQDKQGVLWIATSGGGLDRFDPKTETFKNYKSISDDSSTLSSNSLLCIYEGKLEILWIGTDGGFDKFDKKTGKVLKRYNQSTGFPTSHVELVNMDDDGNLWLGSTDGLIKFNPDTETVRVYNEGDGLQSNVFWVSSGLMDSDGEMWYGGSDGLNSFYPSKVKDNPYVPPVVLTSLKQGGESMTISNSLERTKEIDIGWQNNYFEFEFSALNFTKPEKNQYKFMLEGFDDKWYNAGTMRFGRYSGLPGGTYTLRIQGSNNDGVWNKAGVSMKVKVGTPFWKSWLFYLALISGVIFYIAKLNNEIKERKKSEESLRVKDYMIESASSVIATSDLEGRVTHVNPEFLNIWGFDYDWEVIGKPFSNYWLVNEIIDEIMDELLNKGNWSGEMKAKKKDGSLFDVEVHASTVYDADGNPVALMSSSIDVTDRKLAEEEIKNLNAELEERIKDRTADLETTNKELESFNYSVSHDLRAPLRNIDGFSTALFEDYYKKIDDEGKDYIDRIRNNTKKMSNLIDDLLKLSRITQQQMNKREVDLSAIAKNITEELTSAEPEREIEFIISDNITTRCDEHLLNIVLENIFRNAVKYTAREIRAKIEFGLKLINGEEVYFIKDNGVGFNMNYKDKLFTAFQRLHSDQEFSGAGIGLSIVNRIILRHGGSIWAESNEGEGAVFYFRLG